MEMGNIAGGTIQTCPSAGEILVNGESSTAERISIEEVVRG
jgi:hypothetical protein